jgi:hypothetical protein
MLAGQTKTKNSEGGNAAPKNPENAALAVPFIRATDEHLQPGNFDESRLMTGNAQDLGTQDIPAYGYFSHLYVKVTATGAANGLATVNDDEDAPWNVLQNIALTEPNGAPIVQFNSGYELFLANKYGGYRNPVASDPRRSPLFSAINAAGNFSFILRVPVALSGRSGVGALPNQDSAGQFKFRCTLAPSSVLYDVAPNTLPTIRVQAWLAAYDQPEAASGGAANQTEPPAVGTTSFWTVQSGIPLANGQNTITLTRKGNYLRQIIFVLRNAGTGLRATADTQWPIETRFQRDSFPARYYDDGVWRELMFERTGYTGTLDTAGAPEAGVRFHDYMHEFNGTLGWENFDQWQPTRASTRLEVIGSFQAACTLDVITNDVGIADNVFL